MASPDESRPKPVLTVSWPRLPGRKIGRKHRKFDLCADSRNCCARRDVVRMVHRCQSDHVLRGKQPIDQLDHPSCPCCRPWDEQGAEEPSPTPNLFNTKKRHMTATLRAADHSSDII